MSCPGLKKTRYTAWSKNQQNCKYWNNKEQEVEDYIFIKYRVSRDKQEDIVCDSNINSHFAKTYVRKPGFFFGHIDW